MGDYLHAQEPELVPIDRLKVYDGNAKKHTRAQLDAVEASIKEFGFRGFVIAWHNEDGVPEIVAGHARTTAARNLGMEEVPVVFCDDLTDAQRRALTLADNQTTMMTGWDEDQLAYELETLSDAFDMGDFGFGESVDFTDLSSMSVETEESAEFEEKFKPKRTTDDCYTPPEMYDAIADWAVSEYGIDRKKIVRPFYPGGDYRSFDYSNGKVVLDNPPFSIISEIISFYLDEGVPFFLFAPGLTSLSSKKTVMRCCHIFPDAAITYENGATVKTSFVTSYDEGTVARTAPELCEYIKEVAARIAKEGKTELPGYVYPDNVVTAAMLQRYSKYGVELRIGARDCMPISELDEQKEQGASIFGGGLLLSERAAAERAAAERAAAEPAAAKEWGLSEREVALVESLGR